VCFPSTAIGVEDPFTKELPEARIIVPLHKQEVRGEFKREGMNWRGGGRRK